MGLWNDTKSWVSENRVVAGALTGLAAGSVVPGVGNLVGAIAGAGVGFWSAKEKAKRDLVEARKTDPANTPPMEEEYYE